MTNLTPNVRHVPYEMEAEQSVLGAMLIDNRTILRVSEVLRAGDFFREDHKLIFESILGDYRANRTCDFVTLQTYLKARDQLDDAGGIAYLGMLANDTPSAANVDSYARIVREQSLLRELISIGGDIAELGWKADGRSMDELLDVAERRVMAIRAQTSESGGPEALADLAGKVESAIEKRIGSTGITGLATGLTDLDEKTTGLHPGDVVVLAGRPSMGKTTLALNIAEHCAYRQNLPALVFTMEMPSAQLIERLYASRASIHLDRIRKGRLSDQDLDRISKLGGELRRTPLYFDESPALSPNQIRARARRLKSRHGLGLIVVDYIQLMQVPGTKENRTNEIAEVSRSLKALAKELEVPVIALSQLNRGVEQRDNKRPRLADLRESGGIEQDADIVLLVYRDDVYEENSRYAGTAELIIAKQRNGPLGIVRTAYRGEVCRFDDLAPDWLPMPEPEPERPARRVQRERFRGAGSSHAAHAAIYD